MFMAEILGRCSTFEQRVADIYTQFASGLPQDETLQRNFWRSLASEERQHGRVLAAEKIGLEADMDPGYFLPEYPAKLVSLDATLKQIEEKANQGVNITEAFSLALALEQSELNTIYRDLVLTGRVAGRLRRPPPRFEFVAPPRTPRLWHWTIPATQQDTRARQAVAHATALSSPLN